MEINQKHSRQSYSGPVEHHFNEVGLLLDICNGIARIKSRDDLLALVNGKLKDLLPFVHGGIGIIEKNKDAYTIFLRDPPAIANIPEPGVNFRTSYFPRNSMIDEVLKGDHPVISDLDDLVSTWEAPLYARLNHASGMKEMILMALQNDEGSQRFFVAFCNKKNSLDSNHFTILQGICGQLSVAVTNILANEEPEHEKKHLQEKSKTNYHLKEIIGSGNGLRHISQLVLNVASSDSTVLILGETGTGKELIANAIHNSSLRRDKPMVKLNCATLPSHLIESELFGHEKGSFTGAIERRIGKFELAHNGTLFLDEIGEMTPDLQVKLLRALQEKEIERIGGKSVIKTNVRVIAASNRDLKREVEEGKFRKDLFYRLNVFPISLPPLRDRRDDIPLLASYFIDKFSKKSGQKVKNISDEAVKELILYDWPGNVRELEHIIERSVLMTSGHTITEIQLLQDDQNLGDAVAGKPLPSLKENERAYILTVLKKTNGKIRGSGGAAEILKIPPTTLHSKMKKLGIRKTGN